MIWVVPDQRRRRAVEAALAPLEAEQGGRLHGVATFADLPDLLAPHPPPEPSQPLSDTTNHPQKGGTP